VQSKSLGGSERRTESKGRAEPNRRRAKVEIIATGKALERFLIEEIQGKPEEGIDGGRSR